MLSHKYRFHGHRSLGLVMRKGKVLHGPHMTLRVFDHHHRVHDRAAVVVSRKVAKKAVLRNQIRRRIFEIIRVYWLEIEEPYDIVFIVKNPEILNLSHAKLQKEVVGLLKKGHMTHKQIQQNSKTDK